MAAWQQSPFANAQVDFRQIGDLADRYYAAKDDALKRQKLEADMAYQSQQRGRASEQDAAMKQLAAEGLPKDAQGNIDYQAAADKVFKLTGNFDQANKVLEFGVQSAKMNPNAEYNTRQSQAEANGLVRGSPEWRQFVLTGNLPNDGKPEFGTIGEDRFGGKVYGFIDPRSRSVTPVQSPSGSPQQDAQSTGDVPTGEEYLKTLPKPAADQVRAMVEGRIPPPGSFALRSPYWQKMLQAAAQYDPGFDLTRWAARQQTSKDIATGKMGQNVSSFNTALQHLDTLSKASDGLNNSNYPWANKAANFVQGQYDPNVQAALNKFNVAKQAVASELTRAFRGTGGSLTEVKDWESSLNAADSPQALKAAIQQGIELLRGRIESVGDQYNRGMATSRDAVELLSPKSREIIERLSGGTGQRAAPSGAPAAPAHPGAPIRVNSPDEARRLPRGSTFIDPNGVIRQVP